MVFEKLNSRFHYNLLKHWCCINGTYLAILILSQLFLYNISYDMDVTSCTLLTIVNVLFVTNYIILFLIAIEWIFSIYNRELSEKLRNKKTAITTTFYPFIVFAMCFCARNCVVPHENNYDVFSLIVVVEFFIFLTILLVIAIAHQIKCSLNTDFKKYNTFPFKIAFIGFLTWLIQFVVMALNIFTLFKASVQLTYFCTFLGICTPIFYLILCVVCDKVFRDCLQYVFGCKAYDQICNSQHIQSEV